MQSHGTLSRAQTGKLLVSLQKQEFMECEVAYHLGSLGCDLNTGSLHGEDVFNADETHFVINMDDHKTLSLRSDKDVKCGDAVSGDVGMTMMVLICGGSQAEIFPPFLIFQNALHSYPIRSIPDHVPGLSHRSGPKSWIDRIVMAQWLKELRAISPLPGGRRRGFYMDNCRSHAITDEIRSALESINTEVRFLPNNAIGLVQPADFFVI